MAGLKPNLTQLRFALVGMVNTGIDFGIYSLLILSGLNPFIANIVSTSVGMGVSFVLNRRFTFNASMTNQKRQIALFLLVTISGLWLLQPIVIYGFKSVVTDLLHVDGHDTAIALLGKLLSIGVSLCWNYFWYSKYVFSKPKIHEEKRTT